MPITKANGINLYYEIHGKGEPLIFISGFGQNHLTWTPFIPLFTPHFQMIVFDNRGMGQTEIPEESYSLKILTEDVIGLLDILEIENAHFVGESMGTLIIQNLCLDHRDRVKKAALCAPFSHCPAITLQNARTQLKLLAKETDRILLQELQASWLLSNAFLKNSSNLQKYLMHLQKNPYPPTLTGLLGQFDVLQTNLESEIQNIPHELLLLVGEKDIATPLYCAEYMKERIPNSTLQIFKDLGHMFKFEIPEKTAKHICKFFLE